jgi:hypothetical protein
MSSTTTLARPLTASPVSAALRLAVALLVAAALLVGAFVAGRTSAPSHRASAVSSEAPQYVCRLGRAC